MMNALMNLRSELDAAQQELNAAYVHLDTLEQKGHKNATTKIRKNLLTLKTIAHEARQTASEVKETL